MILSKLTMRKAASLDAIRSGLLPNDPARRVPASHRLMWSLFGEHEGATVDYLWREDLRSGAIYTLSRRAPVDAHNLFEVRSRPFDPVLEAGDVMHFAVRAHATICTKTRGQPKGRREDILTRAMRELAASDPAAGEDKRRAARGEAAFRWFERHGEQKGFKAWAASFALQGAERVRFMHRSGPVTFEALEMSGLIEVTDPAVFGAGLLGGLGRSKAYGCGLMMLRLP